MLFGKATGEGYVDGLIPCHFLIISTYGMIIPIDDAICMFETTHFMSV
jgi:hypothetical protein